VCIQSYFCSIAICYSHLLVNNYVGQFLIFIFVQNFIGMMSSLMEDPQSNEPTYSSKYGIFLFGSAPWPEEPNSRLMIGLTSWVVSAVTGHKFKNSQEVTVQWPNEPFSNYLKLSRGASKEGSYAICEATLLFVSNGT
jgi:hypothetical protein